MIDGQAELKQVPTAGRSYGAGREGLARRSQGTEPRPARVPRPQHHGANRHSRDCHL